MKTRVIMIRHGETDWNVQCRFLGSADRLLTEKGRRQAGYAKNALKDTHIDVAFSSPMKRALETGQIICEDKNLEIILDNDLREINCGEWEGLNGNEVEERYPGQIELWGSKPEECQIEGGESFQEVSDRIIETFWRIVKENRGKTILITSHMICITLIMLYVKGLRINEMWNVKPIGNATLNILEIDENDHVEITAWSDDRFVPDEDKMGSTLVAGRNYVDEENK